MKHQEINQIITNQPKKRGKGHPGGTENHQGNATGGVITETRIENETIETGIEGMSEITEIEEVTQEDRLERGVTVTVDTVLDLIKVVFVF